MRKSIRRRVARSGLVVVGMAMAMVTMSASPASAAEGAGTHEGAFQIGAPTDAEFDPVADDVLLCHKSNLTYDSEVGAGAFTELPTTEAYVGTLDVDFFVPNVWQHFQGTVPGDSTEGCLVTPGTPYPVSSWSVRGPDPEDNLPVDSVVGSLQCSGNEGNYRRVGTVHYVYLEGNCTVNDGAAPPGNPVYTSIRMVGDTVAISPTTICSPINPLVCVPQGANAVFTMSAEDITEQP